MCTFNKAFVLALLKSCLLWAKVGLACAECVHFKCQHKSRQHILSHMLHALLAYWGCVFGTRGSIVYFAIVVIFKLRRGRI